MKLICACLIAAGSASFLLLFYFMEIEPEWFWVQMAFTNLILTFAVLSVDPHLRLELRRDSASTLGKKIALGLASAAALYLLFFAGHAVLSLVFHNSVSTQIDKVYTLKKALPAWQIALLIALIIAPGEELFWRGWLQKALCQRYGVSRGVLLALLTYGGVHITSGNLPLVIAAMICGAFWGTLYQYRGSLAVNITSHISWDLLVFLILPLR